MASQSTVQTILYDALLAEMRNYLRCMSSDLPVSISDPEENYSYTPLSSCNLPVQTQVKACLVNASERSLSLVRAIFNARNIIRWQQSYSVEDGFDEHYLNNYGWFNLISPEGPFKSDAVRVSFGYWGEGLDYKEHWMNQRKYILYFPAGLFSIVKVRCLVFVV